MRKNKVETALSRQQILDHASRLFRERGPESVSVADVMEAAGMTHGGFYKHFGSKDALFAATLESSFAEKLDYLTELSPDDRQAGLRSYLDGYLTLGHVNDRSMGCPIASLTNDALRGSPEAALALSKGAKETLQSFADGTGGDNTAIRALSFAVGAIVLARAVQDERLQNQILEVAANATMAELEANPVNSSAR